MTHHQQESISTKIILARHRLHGGSEGRTGIKNRLLPGEWEKAVADGEMLKAQGLSPVVIVSSRAPDVVQTMLAISEGFAGEVKAIDGFDDRLGDTDQDMCIPEELKSKTKKIAMQKYGKINDVVYAEVRVNDLAELHPHFLRRGVEGAECLLELAKKYVAKTILVGTSGGSRFEFILRTLKKLSAEAIVDYREEVVPYGGMVLVEFSSVDAGLVSATPLNFEYSKISK